MLCQESIIDCIYRTSFIQWHNAKSDRQYFYSTPAISDVVTKSRVNITVAHTLLKYIYLLLHLPYNSQE